MIIIFFPCKLYWLDSRLFKVYTYGSYLRFYEKLEIVNRKQSDKIEKIDNIEMIDTIYELINERFFRERNPKMTKRNRN